VHEPRKEPRLGRERHQASTHAEEQTDLVLFEIKFRVKRSQEGVSQDHDVYKTMSSITKWDQAWYYSHHLGERTQQERRNKGYRNWRPCVPIMKSSEGMANPFVCPLNVTVTLLSKSQGTGPMQISIDDSPLHVFTY
jgi:hypothetical protein